MVDATGHERIMLDAWVRPWLRAVSGDDPSFEWDPDAGLGRASWQSSGGVSEIVVPRRLFGPSGPGTLEIAGEGACFTLDMDRGQLRVLAPAGVEVSVDFGL
jgi:endoglycosylceramidase